MHLVPHCTPNPTPNTHHSLTPPLSQGGVRRGGRPTVASASRPRRDSLAAGVTAQAGDKLYHPQMEKARRDRINRLLNELRVLVPPGPDQVCGGQDKRAKHVVLQDTIALLKALLARNPGAASGSGQSNGATCVAGGGGSTGGATQSPEGSAGNAQVRVRGGWMGGGSNRVRGGMW